MGTSRASNLSQACPAASPAPARGTARMGVVLLVILYLFPAVAILAQSTNVVTWRYDNTHEGQNTNETILTPANVNTNTFGKLFSQPVDGQVYAQPLYMSGLTMPNNTVHNVVFIATENDSLYAFDADTNGGSNASPLWHANLIDTAHGAAAGATPVPSADVDTGTGDIYPEIGVTSTPVIDPSTQTLFVVTRSVENGNYVQRLHAINILNGNEQSGSPVEISASTPGTGNGSSGGTLEFSELWELNRPALDLFNGNIYIAFGSNGDHGPWHGWLLVYNEATLQQSAALCFSPNGNGDAVWMSGEGPPIDTVSANGRMFLTTANGDLTTYPPITSSVDYGESVLRLDLSNGGATPVDAFTAYDQATLTANDLDLGSGGPLMLPDQSGAYPHILIQVGKDGDILVINRDNLGGYAPGGTSNTNILQDISGALASGNGLWSTPAYWNGYVYMWAQNDTLKQFTLTNGVLATQPSYTSAVSSGFPGASPVVSSNGTENGIVWALVTDLFNSNGSSILYAFDALNIGTTLYASDQNPARDDAGPAITFTVPVITNGKVYVGAGYQIDVYGLLDSEPQTPAPVISPAGGNFLTSQGVTITDTASGASIYYTTDGTTPTVASTLYTGPITISASTTLQAIASVNGSLQSTVASATFTFSTQTTPPEFTPAGGDYTSAQTVSLTDSTAGSVIYYTTNGSTPTTGSSVYSSPIPVSASTTINAFATAAGFTPSAVTSATYTFNPYLGTDSYSTAGTDTANYINATYAVTGTASGGYTVSSCSFYQPTGTVTAGAHIDCGLVLAPTPTTQSSSWLCHATYTNPSAAGTGGWITLSLTGCGTLPPGTAYWIATDSSDPLQFPYGLWNCGGTCIGSAPTQGTGSYPYSYVAAPYGVYSGMNTAMNLTTGYQAAQYVTLSSNSASVAATPAFSPGAGNYTSTQSVTISDATPGAVIYYTTNGSTPTTASSIYSSPISVSANTTINAMATAAGYTGSEIGSATYTFNPYLGTDSYSTAGTDTANYINATYAVTGTASGGYTVSSCSFYQPTGTVTAGANIDCGLVLAPTPTTQSSSWLCHATYTNPSAAGTGGWITIPLTGCGTLPAGTAYWVATDNNDPLQFPYGFWNCGGTCNGSAPTEGTGSYSYSYIAAPYGVYSGMNTAMNLSPGDQAAQYVTLISNSASVAETPVFSPAPGTYTSAQSVTISDATPGAVIYYTTDGSTPTTSSAVYTAPIAVSETSLTIQAIAAASGYQNSAIATGVYQIQSVSTVTANPAFSPGSGTYSSSQSVTITDATPGAVIYYTTDGSTPTTTSAVYSSPIAIAANTELQAMAVAPGSSPSAVVTASYVIQVAAGGSINFSTGFASATGLQFNGASKVNSNSYLELTDGGANEAASTFWTTPVNIQSFSTTFAFQLTQATANGFTFTIQNVAANAIGGDAGGLGYGPGPSGTPPGIASSVAVKFDIYNTAGEGTDSTGIYTDGASPTVPAVDITPSGIELDSGDLILAQITYNGTTLTLDLTDAVSGKVFTDSFPVNIPSVVGSSTAYVGFTASTGTATAVQNILNWVFTSGGQLTAGDPVFNPPPGVYNTAQNVTLTSATPGATIYYTVDGSTPSTSSPIYSAPIVVSGASLSIRAFAAASGYQSSPVVVGEYQIQSGSTVAANPVFTPGAGTYSSPQSVAISDATPGAVIYYTTDGSTPTTASPVYSSPIPISASTTINAFATAAGYTPSAVTSAAYTFNPYLGTDSYSTAGTDTANYINATYAVTGTASGGYTVSSCSFYQPTGTVTAGAHIDCGLVLAPTPTTQSSSWLCHATYTNPSAAGAGGWITLSLTGCGTLPPGTAYWIATDNNDPLQFPYGFWNCGGTCSGSAPTQGTGSYSYSYVAAPYGVYSGMNTSMNLSPGYQAAQYVTLSSNSASVAATPAFSPGAGNYTSTQSVTISDATPGAVIYYTTNGSTPTTASSIYNSPISVSVNTTINAMATAAGYTGSEIGSATYTFNPYLGTDSYSTAGTDTANYINATYAVTGTASGGYTVSSCSFYQPTGTVTAGANIDCGLVLAPTPTTQSSSWLCHATYTNPSAAGTGGWITIPLTGCGTLPAGTAYWVATDNNDPLQFPYGFWNCGGTCSGSAPTQGTGSYPYSYIAAPYGVYTGMNTAMNLTKTHQAAQYVTLIAAP